MSLKAFLFLQYSRYVIRKEYALHSKAISIQENQLKKWIAQNVDTAFGIDHKFSQISSLQDFQSRIPLRNYEDFIPYIEEIKRGKKNILFVDKPLYLLMTSGTSAGTKYIPLTKSGIKHQINAALKLLCFYAVNVKNAKFMNFKMIFIQGSPELSDEYAIASGRLSGVVYHHIPNFFQRNKLPRYETNIISQWEDKINTIVEETIKEDISVIGGIPPWCIQYFEKLRAKTSAQNINQIFQNLSIYIHGGVDFSSYKSEIKTLLGENVTCLQTFPASEGFFGIQDQLDSDDMLLLLHQGIFYEFISLEENQNTIQSPIDISQVELHQSYELIITSDSGLWRYRMGDIIQFTSMNPYRIRVVGRTSQFISAFGEHVIGVEIEKSMEKAITKFQLKIEDYHVSPNVLEKRYEWLIEWKEKPTISEELIAQTLDEALSIQNKYYKHLIDGNIIHPSTIIHLPKDSFSNLRKKLGKEGGQNKVIRLSNTSTYSQQLHQL